jgi:hypothetical protein
MAGSANYLPKTERAVVRRHSFPLIVAVAGIEVKGIGLCDGRPPERRWSASFLNNLSSWRYLMTQPTFVEVVKLPGVNDLPGKVRLHFIKALQAEMEGNWLQAEFELNLAVAAEDAFSEPEPAA